MGASFKIHYIIRELRKDMNIIGLNIIGTSIRIEVDEAYRNGHWDIYKSLIRFSDDFIRKRVEPRYDDEY